MTSSKGNHSAFLALCVCVWGGHRSPVNSPHKGQWRGALMFSLICAWINDLVNIREAGDFRRHRARYDVTVMTFPFPHIKGHLLKIFTWFTYILRNLSNPIILFLVWLSSLAWASHQIRKIAGCACAGNAGNVFFRHRLQRKPLVSDPGMHHGTCVTDVPWCMSGSLTHGCGEYVPGIPGACATHKFTYLVRAHRWIEFDLNIELFSLVEKDSQGHNSSWKCRNQIKISPHHPNFPSNSFVTEASNIENG